MVRRNRLRRGSRIRGYDPAGDVTQRTYPDGTVITYGYNDDGRMSSATSAGNSVSYDAAGNPTQLTTPSETTTYGYDLRDRLTSVCYQVSCPGGADPFIRWTYDGVGNRL